MRDSNPQTACCAHEARLMTSVMALGALFGVMASPCARGPLVSLLVVAGVPMLTFAVAAPPRLTFLRGRRLFAAELETVARGGLLALLGRGRDVSAVVARQRTRVEATYAQNSRLAPLVAADPLRLHHARRLAMMAALLTVGAGVGLPLLYPSTYTWGDGATGVLVFAFDILVIGAVARVVSERIAVRLFEASTLLSGGSPWLARMRAAPLTIMLGGALGAVGALVVLSAAAAASALESHLIFDASLTRATFWFLRETAPLALPLGVGVGGLLGAGLGLAQAKMPLAHEGEPPVA